MLSVKVIHNDNEHAAALKEIERLWDKAEPGTEVGDRFELLTVLVEVYEREHHAIEPLDPITLLEEMRKLRGLTKKDLESAIGSRTRVYEVLNRQRPLSITMIRRLSGQFGIPAGLLIAPTVAPKRQNRAAATGQTRKRPVKEPARVAR